MFELETKEGEVLIFDTEDAMIEYVISRMVERGSLHVTGRDDSGELSLTLSGDAFKIERR